MDNYEINILRRDGNWKKVKPKDLLLDSIDQNELHINAIDANIDKNLNSNNQDGFINCLNKINSIISKLEGIENEKNILKNELKIYEEEFKSRKKNTDEKIKLMSKESEMLDKTLNMIKNLKTF
tara:strand:+ start:33 stop:404 length:372 start_codon:yes stop_codon:yes gene_type:complete